MLLKNYQKKRKFDKTPEPKGAVKIKGKNRFVVHKHQASHLHYDFRLELPARIAAQNVAGGPDKIEKGPVVLKSWAVPKGIPAVAGIKHLAVQVEDHPVDYISFHGIIPKGNYGAGKVEIWDKGKFKLIEFGRTFLKIELSGKKLKGKYILTRFGQGNKNWLVFKMK